MDEHEHWRQRSPMIGPKTVPRPRATPAPRRAVLVALISLMRAATTPAPARAETYRPPPGR